MTIFLYLIIGLLAGVFSGAFGVGGGVILVPTLAFLFGLTQHQAQGTALAVLLPPVFILAVWRYYQEGHVQVSMALIIACGFVFGALIGAHFVQGIPDVNLRKAFGILLVLIGIKMILGK
ncbi:MAG: sulfite exporter TauE/SafE family protein [Candidatus Omnitrophica bacterium]|nr:sulfite exporter TauE/SafE family protein [Candidatus Omnitrophota bacterium]